jgi:hypothetical protein
MNIKKLQLPELELVDPNADFSETQVIFIDFDGAEGVSYDNDALNIHIGGLSIADSGLSQEEQFKILTDLNTTFTGTGVTFTATVPANEEYSTIYVGGNDSAFSEYGSFQGLAETIDVGNQIKNDEAFVFSENINSTTAITETIAHETAHLLGFAHEGNTSIASDISDFAYSYFVLDYVKNGNYDVKLITTTGTTYRCELDGAPSDEYYWSANYYYNNRDDNPDTWTPNSENRGDPSADMRISNYGIWLMEASTSNIYIPGNSNWKWFVLVDDGGSPTKPSTYSTSKTTYETTGSSVNITFDWSDSTDKTYVNYTWQLSTSSSFPDNNSKTWTTDNITSSLYTSTIVGGATYYWRVKANDYFNHSSNWSGYRSFTLKTLESITISGSTRVNESSTATYTCTANYSDGSNKTVTPNWEDNSIYYAEIDSSGKLTTNSVTSDKSVTITASYGGKTDTHNVTIKNVPTEQEIYVKGGPSGGDYWEIADGDTSPRTDDYTDFGTLKTNGGTRTNTFQIYNTGETSLSISSVELSNKTDFQWVRIPSGTVSGNGNTYFMIQFNPASDGRKDCTVTINNNDKNEGTYTFKITGYGQGEPKYPEISIHGGGSNHDDYEISDEHTSPSTYNDTSFGSVSTNSGSITKVFTIKNTGDATLNISSYSLSNTNFTFSDKSLTSVGAGNSGTFSIKFDPTSDGEKTCTVTINNDDSDENPYTFTIKGTGTSKSKPSLSITAQDANGAEENSDEIVFRFERTGDTSEALWFYYKLGGEATYYSPADYYISVGTNPDADGWILGNIEAGANVWDLTLTPRDDSDVEGTETVTIELKSSANYDLGTSTANASILDNDSTGGGGIIPQSIVYSQDFSSGKPGESAGWEYYSSMPEGRINANAGKLRMDTSAHGVANLNEAILHLNLSGANNITLKFDYREASSGDEFDNLSSSFTGHKAGDGVAVSSDGSHWYKIMDLNGSGNANINLNNIVNAYNGLNYTSDFQVKFQQYDDYAWSLDGYEIDNIQVTTNNEKNKSDFDGNGKDDILFTNGSFIGYYADGLPSGWKDLGGFAAGWNVSDCADFDGNGKDDILFTNKSFIGYYADGLPSGWKDLGGFAAGWSVSDCADFDGNGKDDILFTNGSFIGYYADGLPSGWKDLGGFAAGWSVTGCADFDGNGKDDILFSNGTLIGYYADGLPSGWKDLGGFAAGWSVTGCADFDGNGKDDILFSNGTLIGYYADGLPSGWHDLGSYASGWHVADCADFDGNGKDDILFSNGTLIGYYADGLPSGWHDLGSYANGWDIVVG